MIIKVSSAQIAVYWCYYRLNFTVDSKKMLPMSQEVLPLSSLITSRILTE